MKNSQNVRIGEVEIYADYHDGNGEIDLGHTKGGADFSFERESVDLTVDQYGSMPLDVVLTGNNLTITAYLAEVTTKNMGRAITEGAFAESGDDAKLGLGRDSGFRMSSRECTLRLHPRHSAPSDRNEDIYIWKAVSSETVELPFKVDEQRVLEVTFRALVDESQPDGYRLGRIGDADIS